MTDVLETQTHGHVRLLRLNRPDRKNALTGELGWAVVDAVRAAVADDDVWVIGVTGNGDAFSSGLDLTDSGAETDIASLSPQQAAMDDLSWVGHFPVVLRGECDKPVVAGINGVAVGAGLSLAMCADLRLASASARFHPGYGRVGISPDGGLTWTLPQAVGYEPAMRFLLELRMIDADEALRIGMVGSVHDEKDFDRTFLDYCGGIAEVAPLAARQTKRLLARTTRPPDLAELAGAEVRAAVSGLRTEDSREAVRAMGAKEKPDFKGR